MAKPGKARAVNAPPPPTISWPELPPYDPLLHLEEVHPGLLIIDSLFPPQSLKLWLSFLTSPQTPIKLLPSPIAKRGEADRTNDRFGIQDPEFAKRLWEGNLEGLLGEGKLGSIVKGKKAVGLNSNIRLYRYGKGTYFGPHYDDDFRDPLTGNKSEWTLLIYLTGQEDGVKGGETAFYPLEYPENKNGRTGRPILVDLKRGRALLHRHGMNHCMLHEGCLVEEGVKWVLRSDVMFG